jgi:hypothetical protein
LSVCRSFLLYKKSSEKNKNTFKELVYWRVPVSSYILKENYRSMEMEKVTLISSKGDYIYLYVHVLRVWERGWKREMNGRENIVLGFFFFFFVFAVKFLTFSTKTRITNYVNLPKSLDSISSTISFKMVSSTVTISTKAIHCQNSPACW